MALPLEAVEHKVGAQRIAVDAVEHGRVGLGLFAAAGQTRRVLGDELAGFVVGARVALGGHDQAPFAHRTRARHPIARQITRSILQPLGKH